MKAPSDLSDHTNECLLDDSSSNNDVLNMFVETFLQEKNQDCLEQVLSFLTCKELASAAMSCKILQHVIFETSDDEGDINMVWHGAEMDLVKPHERTDYFASDRRFGANAREHCRLFVVASTFAEACEWTGEIEEERMMVDGVLANLMNVRGYDADSIVEKKAMAEAATESDDDEYWYDGDEQEESGTHLENLNFGELDAEQAEVMHERLLRDSEKRRNIEELTPPEKVYHHKIFVRISGATTGKVICQGFCEQMQKLAWNAGLEVPIATPQGLEIFLDFESLKQANEVETFLESCSTWVPLDETPRLAFHVTAVVVSETDRSCQSLFERDLFSDHQLLLRYSPTNTKRQIELTTRSIMDTIQLGPSRYSDQYYLEFSFSICKRDIDGGNWVAPIIEVKVRKDTTNADLRTADALNMAVINLALQNIQAGNFS